MLALIAGQGALPAALLAGLDEPPLVCALAGCPADVPVTMTFRLEHLGTAIEQLQAAGVTEICMAGAIARPTVDASAVDAATQPLVPRIMQALAQGDDGALRIVIAIFEEAGLTVKAAHELVPDLLPASGVLGRLKPDADTARDVRAAEAALIDMGARDVGQACVVGNGRIIAREAQDGTDAMLYRLKPVSGGDAFDTIMSPVDMIGEMLDVAAEWLSGDDAQPLDAEGALLFKAPKPDQDRRADLPVIGPTTIEAAALAGLRGIVVEAGGVMILNRDATVAACDAQGLFLWVRPKGDA